MGPQLAIHSVIQKASRSDQIVCKAICRAVEGTIDPHNSLRLQAWDIVEGIAGAEKTALEWSALLNIHHFQVKAENELNALEESFQTGHTNVQATKHAHSAWRSLTCRAIKEATHTPLGLDVFALARNCIYEGCRVMFQMPPGEGMTEHKQRVLVTASGVQHLNDAAYCLERCLSMQHGKKGGLGDFDTFPSAHKYALAMLKWFKWYLCAIDQEALIRHEMAPSEQNERVPCHGPSEVCRDLLAVLSVVMSSSVNPELMTAGLPAAVALARLLNSEGSPESMPGLQAIKSNGPYGHRKTLFVPSQPRNFKDQKNHVLVSHVELGDAKARQIGAEHLKAAIALLSKNSQPLVMQTASSPQDLGGSTTAWEAVWLYKSMTIN
eukprot:CAMPEP_0177620164 /NCGR_PEP_ID=MMETSP0419_2-20121207/26725_1 /TAXON_ID=582737 /ORGANISM="Tetraselmis sp., Strain GSL018" /LENGTH=379 /DNA_ID=CAMNT_0019119635 /DNA_START=259 /DNA_END=1398 /DNA_ORIENTATION=-